MNQNKKHGVHELPVLMVNIDAHLLGRMEQLVRNEKNVPDTCVHRRIAEHAATHPDAVAVSDASGELTYRQLNDRVDVVADWLSAQGVGEEELIGVLGDRNPDFLVAVLAIWKACAAYLPIDPAWPRARSIDVLRQSSCGLVLTTSELGELWASADDATPKFVSVSDIEHAVMTRSGSGDCDPDRLAYVIFTSGSTGRPKGAMVEHRGMLNHLFAKVFDLELTASDRVIQNASQVFDISVWQFIAPVVVGASVRIVSNDVVHDPVLLLRDVEGSAATVLEVVPSMLHMMLEHLESAAERPRLSSLRWLLATGETLSPNLCRRWLAQYPGIPLLNAYGPTECSDDVTHYPIYSPLDSGADQVPIGRPVANMRTYVMRWEGGAYSLCAPGIKGELFVGGPGVGRGYLNDPEATGKAFFRDPFSPDPHARIYRTGDMVCMRPDGVLEFLGRTDRQLKLRGHRIQPEEIEAALREHPSVKDAVVSLWPSGDDLAVNDALRSGAESRLMAFVQPRWRNGPTIAGHHRHQLPNGMAIARHTRSEVDFLYADIFERNAYTKHGLRIRPGDCVVDVGANIGIFSLFAHEMSQGGPIYAFEPVPELFQLLRENLRLYDVNAQLYQYGLARSPGSTTITYYPGFSTLSGMYPDLTQDKDVALSYVRHRRDHDPKLAIESKVEDALIEGLLADRFQSQTREIALTTLSDFITENEIDHIDFLKINVEGAELDVLHGIKPEHWSRIAQVALELHDFDGRLRDVQSILGRYGFDVAVEQDWSLEQSMKTNFYVYARRPVAAQVARSHARSQETRPGIDQARVLSVAEIRDFLRERLPEYMAPSEYQFIERLPLTPTGKVDRCSLLAKEPAAVSGVISTMPAPPRTEMERALVGIWADILGHDKIGIHDNFFDRGGHSLLGARVLARVRTTIGPQLPLRSVFEHPTVASLARAIEAAKETSE